MEEVLQVDQRPHDPHYPVCMDAPQWAEGVRCLVQEDYPQAKRITLVMDNLNTHTGASLYKAFAPAVAHSLLDKLEFVHTPNHGS